MSTDAFTNTDIIIIIFEFKKMYELPYVYNLHKHSIIYACENVVNDILLIQSSFII